MPTLLLVAAALLLGCPPLPPADSTDVDPSPLPAQRFAPDPGSSLALEQGQRQRVMAALGGVDLLLEKAVEQHHLPGLAVGLVYRGQTIWTTGLGRRDLASDEPVTQRTVFRVGSITKTLTGLALLLLRDEGKLSLDAPVARYLPEMARVRYPSRDSPRITVRHLVTHTSGLPRLGKLDYFSRADQEVSEQELLEGLKDLALEAAPGTRPHYSNLGMALAGLVVARVSGVPYRQFVDERLLRPLGLSASTFDRAAIAPGQLATGYKRVAEVNARDHQWRFGAAEAAGGLYSTLEDMARYAAFQLEAWPPRDDEDRGPVRRATVREAQLIAGHGRPDLQSFGVNWAPVSHPRLGWAVTHTGGTFLYGASIWLLPGQQLGVVMLTNTGGHEGDAAITLSRLSVEVLGRVVEALPEPAPAALSPTLQDAVQRARALLATPSPAAVQAQFAPAFLRSISADRVMEVLRRAGGEAGPCDRSEPLRLLGPRAAVVRLSCVRRALELTLSIEEEPPHRFTAFGVKAASLRRTIRFPSPE